MKRYILYISILFTLLSCGNADNQFKLTGQLDHLEQGEFYIYSDDGGTRGVDTINVRNGEFEYTVTCESPATYYLLYPNLSEQVIFATPGSHAKLQGDARHLQAVEVSGTDDNETFTRFRQQMQNMSTDSVVSVCLRSINESPASAVSAYLFRKYVLPSNDVTPAVLQATYKQLVKAQPGNTSLLRLGDVVARCAKRMRPGDTLPAFALNMPQGDTVTNSTFKGEFLLINFWAAWDSKGTALMFRMHRLDRKYPTQLKLLSISLDVDKKLLENIERMDSVDWYSYCDQESWNSPVLKSFALPVIPYLVLVNPQGKIIALGNDLDKDIMPKIEELWGKK